MKRIIVALLALTLGAPLSLYSQAGGATRLRAGDRDEHMRVLVIGAHPDDEDSQLIAWLERGGHAETAYLSLTRGDGGQNLIGNELGEPLGVIRTEELLAARRVDGAHQYFTRAYDFGFSKTAEETFRHWPKDSLLNDVVRVVRTFKPHIILAIFSGTPRDGHGQHQVSAILAKEAYESSSDTQRFPVNQFGTAWTVSKLYRDAWFNFNTPTLRINVGEYDSTYGKSYAEIAAESRSQHRSQGFGTLQRKGVVWAQVAREATRVNASTPPEKETSMFDGLSDIRAPGAQSGARNDFALEAIADRRYVAVGDSANVTVTFYNRSRQPIVITDGSNRSVLPDSTFRWTVRRRGSQVSQPWWLASPRNGDLFGPSIVEVRPATPDVAFGPPGYVLSEDRRSESGVIPVVFQVAGDQSTWIIRAPVVYRYVDPVRGDVQRPLAAAPAISVNLERANEVARANTQLDRYFNVTLRSALMKPAAVRVSLKLPQGLSADSASRTITVDSAATRTVSFRVRGKLPPGIHNVNASAMVGDVSYRTGFVPIEYEHISPERIYRPAEVALHAIDVSIPSRLSVGYIKGVGDNVEPTLVQLGIPVSVIEPGAIPTVDLSKFTTVVVGPRAYQASRDLIDNNSYLLNFARNGGTLVVQYGQYEMQRPGMMPYAITIANPHDRVTEETAPITIIDGASPALKSPNTISDADFGGWVQERSLYMPRTFDEHYHPVVALNDPGEQPNRGGILVTPYGRGLYVYTTLAFFRQLPAGVSGATRLFVNLLSMTNSSGH
jgi:LmbE family N-acetylglucosaminyl deacetylase